MQLSQQNLNIILTGSVLVFSIILLCVSGNMIRTSDNYDRLFRPERGLAGYNVFVSVLGILVGAFALSSSIKSRKALGKSLTHMNTHIPLPFVSLFSRTSCSIQLYCVGRRDTSILDHCIGHSFNECQLCERKISRSNRRLSK